MEFCEKLREHIKDSHLSIRKTAAISGIDRTLLQKYLSGERFPKSQKEIEKIAYAIALTPFEKEELLELYYKASYGKQNYESFLYIRELLEGKTDFHVSMDPDIAELECAASSHMETAEKRKGFIQGSFYGRYNVIKVLAALLNTLHDGQEDGKCSLRIVVQPYENKLLDTLLLLCSGKAVSLEHIICLDANRRDNGNLTSLFPVLKFEYNDIDYHCRYYYQNFLGGGIQMM